MSVIKHVFNFLGVTASVERLGLFMFSMALVIGIIMSFAFVSIIENMVDRARNKKPVFEEGCFLLQEVKGKVYKVNSCNGDVIEFTVVK